jgi:hypothetical protein
LSERNGANGGEQGCDVNCLERNHAAIHHGAPIDSNLAGFGPARMLDGSRRVVKQQYYLRVRDKAANGVTDAPVVSPKIITAACSVLRHHVPDAPAAAMKAPSR